MPAAGDQGPICQGTVFQNIRHPELCRIPWHIRMIPRQPRQFRLVGVETWRGIEISTALNHLLGRLSVELNADERVDCFASGGRVIFSNTDQSMSSLVDDAIGISPIHLRSYRHRILVDSTTI